MACAHCPWPAGCASSARAKQRESYCHHEQRRESVATYLARGARPAVDEPRGFALLPGAGIIRGEAV